jgi:hypothetical protein
MTQAPLITPEMLHLIAQLDEAKGQWQALRNLTPQNHKKSQETVIIKIFLLKRFALESSPSWIFSGFHAGL